MTSDKETAERWVALRHILRFAEDALHAHGYSFPLPEMPDKLDARDWLAKSLVLRVELKMMAQLWEENQALEARESSDE